MKNNTLTIAYPKNLRMPRPHNLMVWVLLIFGFFLRIYAANSVPFIGDEEEKFLVGKEISFSPESLNLPLGHKIPKGPLLAIYIVKITSGIFGKGKIANRMPFIVLSTVSLFFVYKLVKEFLSRPVALLTLLLLTFSQYHIGVSRLMDENTLLLFFCSLAVYYFFKFLTTHKNIWFFLTTLILGLGYLSKELNVFLALVFLIFMSISRKNRNLLSSKKKEMILGLVIMLLVASPHLIWSAKNNFHNFTYKQQYRVGFSLRSFYLYFAELPAIMSQYRPGLFIWPSKVFRVLEVRERILRGIFPRPIYFSREEGLKIRMDGVYEYPVVDLVTGTVIFLSILHLLLNKDKKEELMKFSLLMFSVTFIIPSLFDPSSLFAYHYWASLGFLPAMIMVSYALVNLSKKYRIYGNVFAAFFIIYTLFRAVSFAGLPENYFLAPKKEFYGYCLDRVEEYRRQGKISDTIRVSNWLLCQRLDEETKSIAEKTLKFIQQ